MRSRRAALLLLSFLLPAALSAQVRSDSSARPPVSDNPGDAALFRVQSGVPRANVLDTSRAPRPIVLSDAYGTRLTIHRTTAYAIVPLFAYQYLVGSRLWDGVHEGGTPDWVRPAHKAGAIAIGTAFGINLVTGAMNLWETRSQPEGRVTRLLHAASMTTALAGFTYAGAHLSQEARTNADARRQHRNVALGSMALTLVSGTMMWLSNR